MAHKVAVGPIDPKQFGKFLVVGGSSSVVTLAARALLNQVVIFEAAVAVAHVIGLTMAFLLGRRVVFTDFTGSLTGAYGRFAIVNMVSLTLATGVSWLAYRHLLPMIGSVPYDDYVAHILGLGSAAIPSYLGHRYFSFRVR